MERVNRIINDFLWKEKMEEIRRLESKRKYCGHGPAHLIAVARISSIESLEKNLDVDREIIYAAALLHDIGRGEEYKTGIPHEIAGQSIAAEILRRTGFTDLETDAIVYAIGKHRDKSIRDEDSIAGILYRADKKSRMCCLCQVEKECDWSPEKKNMTLTV